MILHEGKCADIKSVGAMAVAAVVYVNRRFDDALIELKDIHRLYYYEVRNEN